jgi:hypothetical protein
MIIIFSDVEVMGLVFKNQGQPYLKTPPRNHVFKGYRPFVAFNYAITDGKPQPRTFPLFLGSEEGIKYSRDYLRRYARAGVNEPNKHEIPVPSDLDSKTASARHDISRVNDEIEEDLF